MFGSIASAIGSFVSGLFSAAYKWAAAIFAALWMKWKGRAQHAEDVLEKKDRMAEVDAKPKYRRDELLKRMRERKRGED